MVFTNAKNTESVQKNQLFDAAKQLLDAAGVDGDLFEDALKTIQIVQEQSSSINNQVKKNYIDKKLSPILKKIIHSEMFKEKFFAQKEINNHISVMVNWDPYYNYFNFYNKTITINFILKFTFLFV